MARIPGADPTENMGYPGAKLPKDYDVGPYRFPVEPRPRFDERPPQWLPLPKSYGVGPYRPPVEPPEWSPPPKYTPPVEMPVFGPTNPTGPRLPGELPRIPYTSPEQKALDTAARISRAKQLYSQLPPATQQFVNGLWPNGSVDWLVLLDMLTQRPIPQGNPLVRALQGPAYTNARPAIATSPREWLARIFRGGRGF